MYINYICDITVLNSGRNILHCVFDMQCINFDFLMMLNLFNYPQGLCDSFQHESLQIKFTVGLMLSTIIMQGDRPPRIFSPTICQYISGGFEKCNPTIEEVPNLAVRSSLLKVIGHACHATLNWIK